MSTNTLPVAPFLHPQEHAVSLRVVEKGAPATQSEREKLLAMALAGNPTAKPKAGHSYSISIPEIEALTNAFAGLSAACEDSKRRKEECAAKIIAVAEPRRVELSRQTGNVLSSLKVNGLSYVYYKPRGKGLEGPRILAAIDLLGENWDDYSQAVAEIKGPLTKAMRAALEAAGIPYTVRMIGTDKLHKDRTLNESVRLACLEIPEWAPVAYVAVKGWTPPFGQ